MRPARLGLVLVIVLVLVLERGVIFEDEDEDDYEDDGNLFDHAGEMGAKDIAMEKGRGLDKLPTRERNDE